MVVMILGKDMKAQRWAASCAEMGLTVILETSRFRAIRKLISGSLTRSRIDALMFRYLNDHPKVTSTLLILMADVALMTVMIVVRCHAYWICHNVDKETKVYHPSIAAVRRALVARFASGVFVTDPMLVDPAKRLLPSHCAKKIHWTCFGFLESYGEHKPWGSKTGAAVGAQVRRFTDYLKLEAQELGKRPLVGLCLGRPGEKYLHFDYANELLAHSERTPYHVGLIVAINRSSIRSVRQRDAVQELGENSRVLLFDREIGFDETEMRDFYDFFWRGCNDWSTPITVYVAASVGRPILALDCGFLAVLVRAYELGATIGCDMKDLSRRLDDVATWNGGEAARFLAERGWDVGARQFIARTRGDAGNAVG